MSAMTTLTYVVDQKGWVQHQRVQALEAHQNRYRFKVVTAKWFPMLWRLGWLKGRPVVFSTWRILLDAMARNPNAFSPQDYDRFMGCVTSHSNLGGGLDPLRATRPVEPAKALELGVSLLKRYKVVSVNSKPLYDLLSPHLDNLVECPTGVDTDFFVPGDRGRGTPLRVGWVGKRRTAKNLEVLEEVASRAPQGMEVELLGVGKNETATMDRTQMRQWYQGLDYYLCASWNEGTPNPGLEALACGVPVITTRVGNMVETIEDGKNGYFVEPTVESVLEVLGKAQSLSEADHRAQREAARASVEPNWGWGSRIDGFVSAFERLCHG